MTKLVIQRSFALLAAAAIACGTAGATAIQFGNQTGATGQAMGDTLTYTVGSVTVTESAWYASNTSSTTDFAKAAVDAYSGVGLGVCNSVEGAACGSPQHQLDNNVGVDFVLLKFSTAVDISSIDLYDYQNFTSGGITQAGVNMTYYTAQTSLADLSTSTTLGSLGTGTTVNAACSTTSSCQGTTTDDSVNTGAVSYILIGASVPDAGTTKVDQFKLSEVDFTLASAPEPGTFWLFGLALTGFAGFSYISRMRRQNAEATVPRD